MIFDFLALPSLAGLIALSASQILCARVESGQAVSGTVLWRNGSPGAGASVRLYSSTQVFQTKAGPNGGFGFFQVPPGAYELQSTGAGSRRTIIPNVPVSESGAPHDLEVALEFLQCDVSLLPALPDYAPSLDGATGLRGTVETVVLHKPLPNARVDVIDPVRGYIVLFTFTDHVGAFRLASPFSGRCTIRVASKGRDAAVSSDVWLVSGYIAHVVLQLPRASGKQPPACQ